MKISDIKKEFPIFKKKINKKNLVYLDSANSSQKPQSVINRMSFFMKMSFLTLVEVYILLQLKLLMHLRAQEI